MATSRLPWLREVAPWRRACIVDFTQDWPIWTLISLGVLASVINSVAEEAVYVTESP